MEGYRYQQFAYLLVPVVTGIEFFRCARSARKTSGKETSGALTMDACGYAFILFIPGLFLFTIFAMELKLLPLLENLLHRFDHYAVMFLYLGSWWQTFLITALRARRLSTGGKPLFRPLWLPYLALGSYVSALILSAAPFYLMWVSIFWFVASFVLFATLGLSAKTLSKVFFVFAGIVFIGENIFFIIWAAIV